MGGSLRSTGGPRVSREPKSRVGTPIGVARRPYPGRRIGLVKNRSFFFEASGFSALWHGRSIRFDPPKDPRLDTSVVGRQNVTKPRSKSDTFRGPEGRSETVLTTQNRSVARNFPCNRLVTSPSKLTRFHEISMSRPRNRHFFASGTRNRRHFDPQT